MTHPVSLRAIAAAAALFGGLTVAQAQETIFYSTQLRPIEEATKVREVLLKGLSGKTTYVVDEPPAFAVRMKAETQAGKRTASVVGALHGELQPHVPADLQPVDDVAAKLTDRGIPASLMDLGKLGTGQQQYIPWMQATYVMVANKQALQYLPAGADVNSLTYAQLQQWGKNIVDKTGQRRLGFPAGPTGLLPRFFQGYFYPSFTGGVVTTFKSADAQAGWNALKELWAVSNPNSTNYNFMQEPLLSGEVWIAWDHIARVKEALTLQPDQFVAFPAPAGPKGRGYMPVIAGLAIPKDAPNRAGAVAVIEHLTKPQTQLATAAEVGFFPVVKAELPADLAPGIKALAGAVAATQNAKDALVSLLPVGLGAKGGEFNKVYMDSFQRIVLRNEPVKDVLEAQAKALDALMKDTGAPCWAPDKPSQGACAVQ
ncbi:ABC transporter substrate-binding protein [Microvirga sp. CF3016]|uniref:ABC transporter substrate-binding protein n=1 Tax=Microvirga sp. CF3016 TaxID=3110181 RepID=UPI002E789484|nr:ABC transporter substrate-binding protein [Microvirga sp. CF3016]MEE1612995.1 ABC transporter substrate-binding protein [Microvirga sp. CF3016]